MFVTETFVLESEADEFLLDSGLVRFEELAFILVQDKSRE
ncbi:hypothetical protein AOT82_1701 [Psychrobacter sp. AntiMn-1]|nr:hypothetical protein AOT82_1701 [Psychrobacter sp. AntiMn-1]